MNTSNDRQWSDWVVVVVIFAFCLIIAYLSTTFEKAADIIVGHAMQPRNFPMFLMATIALLNGVLIWQLWRNPEPSRPRLYFHTWATATLFGLFYLLTAYLDFFIALIVVMFAMCLLWGERRWSRAALLAILTPAIIFVLFDLLLKVRFPRGLLTNLYYD